MIISLAALGAREQERPALAVGGYASEENEIIGVGLLRKGVHLYNTLHYDMYIYIYICRERDVYTDIHIHKYIYIYNVGMCVLCVCVKS